MNKILLIGDSIRIGYCDAVRDALKDICEVGFPGDNCRFAEYVFCNLPGWKRECFPDSVPDVVHWNAGLWDTCHFSDTEPITPPDFYAHYIEKISLLCERLFPGAKIIFASTTPVRADMYGENPTQKNDEIVRYNEIAVQIARRHGFGIDDLHAAAAAFPKEYYSDAVHLNTPAGKAAMANAVLRSVCGAIGIDCPRIPQPNE